MKTNAPCYGCERRNVGCHSNCKEYLNFEKMQKEENEAEYKKKSETNDYFLSRKNRWKEK